MVQESLFDCPPPTGSDDELQQPAVVIDMPEIAGHLNRRRLFRFFRLSGLIAVFAILVTLNLLELTAMHQSVAEVLPTDGGRVVLTVNVVPPQATVKLDGVSLDGDPPTIELDATDDFHSIEVAASGYESLTRDVRLKDSQTIKVRLRRLDRGSPDDRAVDQGGTEDDEIVFEFQDDVAGSDGSASLVRRNRAQPAPLTPRHAGGSSVAPGPAPLVEEDKSDKPTGGADLAQPVVQPQPRMPVNESSPAPVRPVVAAPEKIDPPKPAVVEENPYEADVPGGTLVITLPAGVSGPVEVFIDKKKHGVAPVTVELSRGLHEVVFIAGGKRAFKMVNIRSDERRLMEAVVE